MKCVACGSDSRRKDIPASGCCPRCGRAFAFAGQTETPVRDYMFHLAIQRVSSRDTVHFGEEHLYHELRRRIGKRERTSAIPLALVLGGAAAFVSGMVTRSLLVAILVSAAVIALLSVRYLWRGPVQSLTRERFRNLLRLYGSVHGVPRTLIEPRRVRHPQSALAPAAQEELAHYSFDRAVICDQPETVDLLIANQFHFENNCAVLGVHGYPPESFALVRRMLHNNPRLVVLALHDASEEGCRMANRLRDDPEWFRARSAVVDVGLRPAHAKFFPRLQEHLETEVRVEPGAGITRTEAEWLSRHVLRLAVVPPEQIIKRLFRAIHVAEQRDVAGGGDAGGDVILFGTHAEASDGGGDSFG